MNILKNTSSWVISLFILMINLSGFIEANAQQEAQYSMYMYNTMAVNPGYSGSKEVFSATLLHRHQWISFPGAPVTQTLSLHTPFPYGLAGGISISNDKIGALNMSSFYVDIAYRIKFKKSKLSFGMKAGFDVMQAHYANVDVIDVDDFTFSRNLSSKMLINIGSGIYYYSNNYYIGVSTPRFLKNKLSGDMINITRSKASQQEKHYYIIGGIVIPLSTNVKLLPSFQAKFTEGAPFIADFNAGVLFYNYFKVGAFYRLKDALGMMTEVRLSPQLKLGLNWDQSVSSLKTYNFGTYEIMLNYDFVYSKDKIKSTRYF